MSYGAGDEVGGIMKKEISNLTTDFRGSKDRSSNAVGLGLRLDDGIEVAHQSLLKSSAYAAYANDVDNLNKLYQMINADKTMDGTDRNNAKRYIKEYTDSLNNFK